MLSHFVNKNSGRSFDFEMLSVLRPFLQEFLYSSTVSFFFFPSSVLFL